MKYDAEGFSDFTREIIRKMMNPYRIEIFGLVPILCMDQKLKSSNPNNYLRIFKYYKKYTGLILNHLPR